MKIENGYLIFERGETIVVQQGDEWRYPKLEGYREWRAFGEGDIGRDSTVPSSCQYRRPVTNGLEQHFII